jgi:transcriptional regulator
MHPTPIFRQTEPLQALAFARSRSFGTLAISSEGAPLMAHVPVLISADGTQVEMHLLRSNPISRACQTPRDATLVVLGPDGYISPDWYGVEDQVPTWNYVAVQFTGTLHLRPEGDLEDLLARQSAALEAFLPKQPWTMDKMSPDTKSRFLRVILPFRLEVADIQSTFKLNQNKPDAARLRAARAVEDGFGSDLGALSDLMRQPPGKA